MGKRSRLTAMHGFLPIFFLLVVLKIPVLGSLWLVWWAAQEPKPDDTAAPGAMAASAAGRRSGPAPAAPTPRLQTI